MTGVTSSGWASCTNKGQEALGSLSAFFFHSFLTVLTVGFRRIDTEGFHFLFDDDGSGVRERELSIISLLYPQLY